MGWLRIRKWLMVLGFLSSPFVLYYLYRYLWGIGPNLYQPWGISLCIISYVLGGYLLAKGSFWGKVLVFLTTVTAAFLIITIPITGWITFSFNLAGSLSTLGIGIFLVSRQGCLLRGWGIVVILATLFTGVISGVVSFGSFVAEKEITGQNKQAIISDTSSMVDQFFTAWNTHDYEAFQSNFTDDLKKKSTKNDFTTKTYSNFGNFVAKQNPVVYKSGFDFEVDYLVDFTKAKKTLFHFQFSKTTGQYLINGYKLEPSESSTTHQKK